MPDKKLFESNRPFPPSYYREAPYPINQLYNLLVGILIGMGITAVFSASNAGGLLYIVFFFVLVGVLFYLMRISKEKGVQVRIV